jgi:hypothetical protein
MPDYVVTYTAHLEAASHEDAARTVAIWMRDEECGGPVLDVVDENGKQMHIDTDKLVQGMWQVYTGEMSFVGQFDSYADAIDVANEVNGTVKFLEF